MSQLLDKAKEAKQMAASQKEAWDDINQSIDPELTSRWATMSTEPFLENGKWTSVFTLKQISGKCWCECLTVFPDRS